MGGTEKKKKIPKAIFSAFLSVILVFVISVSAFFAVLLGEISEKNIEKLIRDGRTVSPENEIFVAFVSDKTGISEKNVKRILSSEKVNKLVNEFISFVLDENDGKSIEAFKEVLYDLTGNSKVKEFFEDTSTEYMNEAARNPEIIGFEGIFDSANKITLLGIFKFISDFSRILAKVSGAVISVLIIMLLAILNYPSYSGLFCGGTAVTVSSIPVFLSGFLIREFLAASGIPSEYARGIYIKFAFYGGMIFAVGIILIISSLIMKKRLLKSKF